MTIKTADVAHMYKLARRNGCPNTVKVLYGLLVHGLGEQQRSVFQALPLQGATTIAKMSKKTGLKRRNIHQILSDLEKMGLVDREEAPLNNNEPHKWRVVHLGFDR